MSLWNSRSQEEEFGRAPEEPYLNRQNCLSPKGIRTFLKLLRLASDDVLKQRLNSVFDKSHLKLEDKEKEVICGKFLRDIIYPAWTSREKAIEYCDREVTGLRREIEKEESSGAGNGTEAYNLRLDPYAERDGKSSIEKKYEKLDNLSNWLSNEKFIEGIVRDQSAEILRDTCSKDVIDWDVDFQRYKHEG